MGVRVSIYAVDAPQFEVFIGQTIGEALWHYGKNGSDRERIIHWDDKNSDRRFYAVPGDSVAYVEGGHRVSLTKARIAELPFLQKQVRDYLAEESSYALMWFLRALSRCPPLDFVREITAGFRRWWIGSLLDYAERAGIGDGDFARFVILCQKLLRGRNCGKLLPEREFTLTDFSFPVIPSDDTDLWMGIWSEGETQFALDFLGRIKEQRPRFKPPPGPVGITPETEEEWDNWVQEMIRQVLIIAELRFDKLNVVTFIG